jgi:hypothetical protein
MSFCSFFRTGLISAILSAVPASADSVFITGTVGTVGSNLGTSIDGASPSFPDRDAFEITLTYNPIQTPHLSPAGGGVTASYNLLQTVITIFPDETGPLTWTFSTPAMDNISHSFGVTNDVFGQDRFTSGLSGATFSGPALNGKNFSFWSLQLVDFEGTAYSNYDIPSAFDNLLAFNLRTINLTFDGFMTEDVIGLNIATITVIPEPAHGVLAGGLGALAVAMFIRRRRMAV